jgi:hypothetical protein
MKVFECSSYMDSKWGRASASILQRLAASAQAAVGSDCTPVRFFVTRSHPHVDGYEYSVSALAPDDGETPRHLSSIFEFEHCMGARANSFNAVMIVPTGVGAEVGGHAGDATPAARLLGSICDNLILHPNVVNSSAINEMPSNALYVEGSILTRFLMGTCGLTPVRSNKVLVVLDGGVEGGVLDICRNMVAAARAVLGIEAEILVLPKDIGFKMRSDYTESGAAVGEVNGLGVLCDHIKPLLSDFDTVAISSPITMPEGGAHSYMTVAAEMVNPWGGVEAMLTHTMTMLLGKPVAHAPLMATLEEADALYGVVDPRKASEAAVGDYTYCTVKGLAKAPQIAMGDHIYHDPGVLNASDVDCVVMPDTCFGLPTLACFAQGIPLILVKNRNWMQNRPDLVGPCIQVDSYMEAAGAVAALREGISMESLRRPLKKTRHHV